MKRLKEEDLKRLLEESSKLLNVKLDIMAIDTGLREDNSILLCEEEWKEEKELD